MPIDDTTAQDAIAAVHRDLQALDHDTMNCVVGISEALHELRGALKQVDQCLNQSKYQEAANLGYGSVSSGYVFLQRTLGELNSLETRKTVIVQDLARKLSCAYEDIVSHVDASLQSMQPQPVPSTDQEPVSLQRNPFEYPIDRLKAQLELSLPRATAKIRKPRNSGGVWWLDVTFGAKTVAIEWYARRGFRLSGGYGEGGYGEGPDETFETTEAAFQRILSLLRGAPTRR